MRIGVDSSVLVAAMHANHPLHAVAASWAVNTLDSDELVITHHTVLECYAVLTRLPGALRVTGDEARRLLEGTVRANMTVADFRPDWMWDLIDWMSGRHVAGGRSYDAFAFDVLRRAGVERFATFNTAHFRDLDPKILLVDPSSPVGID